uniref:Uncharacterized protein n=1 Tax=Anopheles arabiensis TaxID=7173 RepID=A0A182IFX0_ANOAR
MRVSLRTSDLCLRCLVINSIVFKLLNLRFRFLNRVSHHSPLLHRVLLLSGKYRDGYRYQYVCQRKASKLLNFILHTNFTPVVVCICR